MMKKLSGFILFIIALVAPVSCHAAKITIMGSGYVGLTMAAVLLQSDHAVTCVDVIPEKIAMLQRQEMPIYEPQLDELLFNSAGSQNLLFTSDASQAMSSDIFLICVPTPTDSSGKCDCTYLFSALDTIIAECSDLRNKIVCIKSTIPPGTINQVKDYLERRDISGINLAYNPEFLREGSAIHDIYHSNPIVIAADEESIIERIEELYRSFITPRLKVVRTNFETAEMIKYSWNSFSAIRVAYINELAVLCRKLNADIFTVVQGLGLSEELLPTHVIKPGPGFGGSCLPKDTTSFRDVLEHYGFTSSLVHQAIISNVLHKQKLLAEILKSVEGIDKPTVAVLGLSFKANTNDIRNAPAIDIIEPLLKSGVTVKAYDPQAIDNMKRLFPAVEYFDSPYDAVFNVDCIVVLTEWSEIKTIDLQKVASLCKKKVLFDTRNLFNIQTLDHLGFLTSNMGARRK
jgi:UDPglucose 6-dehydrogenase